MGRNSCDLVAFGITSPCTRLHLSRFGRLDPPVLLETHLRPSIAPTCGLSSHGRHIRPPSLIASSMDLCTTAHARKGTAAGSSDQLWLRTCPECTINLDHSKFFLTLSFDVGERFDKVVFRPYSDPVLVNPREGTAPSTLASTTGHP